MLPAPLDLHADLEIQIAARSGDGWPVVITFSGERELARGRLAASAELPRLDGADPVADGRRLFEALFADPPLAAAWAEARGLNPRRRLRLRIDNAAADLHAVPWELLREPPPSDNGSDSRPDDPGCLLAAEAATPFSRFLAGNWRRGEPVLERPLKVLLAIACPTGLPPRYEPLDAAAEEAVLRDGALGAALAAGEAALTVLPQPVTLAALEEALLQGFHILHMVAHGSFGASGEAVVYLADAEGALARIEELDFARIFERENPLRLVFLATCKSANRAADDTFAGLAPRLVERGVPAVLAMQDAVEVATARELTRRFYPRLMAHGQVDLAVNEARAAVLTAEATAATPQARAAAVPVLFLRLREGRLLLRRGRIQGRRPEGFWDSLASYVGEGRCLPILGPGVLHGLLPGHTTLARRLAEKFDYPFPAETENLPRVAELARAWGGRYDPHRQVLDLLARGFLQRYGLPAAAPGLRVSQLAASVGDVGDGAGDGTGWSALSRRCDETEIHHQLADLGLPLYLTTNWDSFMTLALAAGGRAVRREVLPWREERTPATTTEGGGQRVYDLAPPATREQPVVLHLFGLDDDPASLVLTEDDHLDYLTAIARAGDNCLPSSVGAALTEHTLLFLGYRLQDLDLKVLLRGFLSRGHLASAGKEDRLQIAVQIDPQEAPEATLEAARTYFEKYFSASRIEVYWGSTQQFVGELHAAWRTRQGGGSHA